MPDMNAVMCAAGGVKSPEGWNQPLRVVNTVGELSSGNSSATIRDTLILFTVYAHALTPMQPANSFYSADLRV